MIDVEGATPEFAANATQALKSEPLFSTHKDLQYICLTAVFVCVLSYYICTYFWPWFDSVCVYYTAQKRILQRLADDSKSVLKEQEELQAMLQQYEAAAKHTPNVDKPRDPDFKLSVPNPVPPQKSREAQPPPATQSDSCAPAFSLKRIPHPVNRSSVTVPKTSCSSALSTQSSSPPIAHTLLPSNNSPYHRDRELIAQQDAEFEESAAIDRMKMHSEANTSLGSNTFTEYDLKGEPESGCDVVTLSVRIPDMSRGKSKQITLRRRFRISDNLSHAIQWVKNAVKSNDAVELVLLYPQLVLTESMSSHSLRDVEIVENTALVFRRPDTS